jgi:hypothetical protein
MERKFVYSGGSVKPTFAFLIMTLTMISCGNPQTSEDTSDLSATRTYEAKCGDHWFNAAADINNQMATIYLDGDSGPSHHPIKALVATTQLPSGKPQYKLQFRNGGYLKISMFQGSWGYGYWRETGDSLEFDMSCQVTETL